MSNISCKVHSYPLSLAENSQMRVECWSFDELHREIYIKIYIHQKSINHLNTCSLKVVMSFVPYLFSDEIYCSMCWHCRSLSSWWPCLRVHTFYHHHETNEIGLMAHVDEETCIWGLFLPYSPPQSMPATKRLQTGWPALLENPFKFLEKQDFLIFFLEIHGTFWFQPSIYYSLCFFYTSTT